MITNLHQYQALKVRVSSVQPLQSKAINIIKGKKSKFQTIISEKCGLINEDNVMCTFNNDTKVFIISGTSHMNHSIVTLSPWDNYRDEIKNITIEKEVTSIGNSAFSYCKVLESVSISDTNISIEIFAITSITIGQSVMTIECTAFNRCNSLTSIDVNPNNL